jgi:hypothetical protein
MRTPTVSNSGPGQQLGLFDVPAATPAPRPTALPPVRGGRPEVRYRNPDDPRMAWTGRGKPPRWVSDWVQGGKPLEALRVPGTNA